MDLELSIIITCYNHSNFIEEAILSAIQQKINNKEIFVLDNGSEDESFEKIQTLKKKYPELNISRNPEGLNYCKAFNQMLIQANGKYIIDLSGDDVLDPNMASNAIKRLKELDSEFGLCFGNAEYIDAYGRKLRRHFSDSNKVPEGQIFAQILGRHVFPQPSMLVKKEVFDALDGYNEELEYEDFDFLIRASRNWKIAYTHKIQVKVRKHHMNFGKKFYKRSQHHMLISTFKTCLMASKLIKDKKEEVALIQRCRYHMRQALFTEHFKICRKYLALIHKYTKPSFGDRFYYILSILQLPVYPFYRQYIRNH